MSEYVATFCDLCGRDTVNVPGRVYEVPFRPWRFIWWGTPKAHVCAECWRELQKAVRKAVGA